MKQFSLLLAAAFCTAATSFGQINQYFDNLSNLHVLNNQCWQLYGVYLHADAATQNKSLSLQPPITNAPAWIRTAYIELTATSAIRFSYKLSHPLPAGTSRQLLVRLMGIDGSSTPLGTVTLDSQAGTALQQFSVTSPLAGIYRLVMEVTATGQAATEVLIDDLEIEGMFEYNAPYGCKDNGDGVTSIHYLKNFRGQLNSGKVQLQWTVAENENNSYFEVEKSTDGRTYNGMARLSSTGKPGEEAYTFADPAQLQSSVYYRLKLVSKTNTRMYSNVVYLKSSSATTGNFSLLQNPVSHQVKCSFLSESNTPVQFTIYSLTGNKILQQNSQAVKGVNVFSLPLSTSASNGIYLLEVVFANHRNTVKFQKQ